MRIFLERLISLTGLLIVVMGYQNCGQGYAGNDVESLTTGSTQLASNGSSLPVRIPLKVDCTKTTDGLTTVYPESKIAWHAQKSTAAGLVAVEGSLNFDAIAYKESGSTDTKIKLRFDMASLNSGVDLRNQRIRDVMFGAAKGYQLEYIASISAARMLAINSAAVGQSTAETLVGSLNIWGKLLPLNVPVNIVRTATGYQVTSQAGLFVGLLTGLGLQSQVDQLAVLCGAPAQDVVNTDFSFNLVKACP